MSAARMEPVDLHREYRGIAGILGRGSGCTPRTKARRERPAAIHRRAIPQSREIPRASQSPSGTSSAAIVADTRRRICEGGHSQCDTGSGGGQFGREIEAQLRQTGPAPQVNRLEAAETLAGFTPRYEILIGRTETPIVASAPTTFAGGAGDKARAVLPKAAADHAVEGLREPHLVPRGNRHHGVERATLYRSSPGRQTTHRTHQAEGDGAGDDDAEQRGDRQQRQANLNNVPLVGAGPDDGDTGEATHLAPRGIDLAVEIVTPIV